MNHFPIIKRLYSYGGFDNALPEKLHQILGCPCEPKKAYSTALPHAASAFYQESPNG